MNLFKHFVLGIFISYFLVETYFFIKENFSLEFKSKNKTNNMTISHYIVLTYNPKFRFIVLTKYNGEGAKLYHLFTLIRLENKKRR